MPTVAAPAEAPCEIWLSQLRVIRRLRAARNPDGSRAHPDREIATALGLSRWTLARRVEDIERCDRSGRRAD